MDRATEALAGLDWRRLEGLAEELQELAASGALLLASPALIRRQRVFGAVADATKANLNVLARVSGRMPIEDKDQPWER